MEQALRNVETEAKKPPLAAHWQAGIARQRDGDTAGAIAAYQRHLARHPQDTSAWMTLAAALRRVGELDAALVCAQRALRLSPRDAVVWSALGGLWNALGQCEQALRSHRRALELDPLRLVHRIAYARSLADACRLEEAEHVIEDCLAREPGRADLRYELSQLRLAQGRHREAWPDHEARWLCGAAALPALDSPRWGGERIGARRVLLLEEPDRAATLWALRYLPLLLRRGADLTLAVERGLHPLLQDLPLRLIDSHDPRVQGERYDFHCPLMSLPGVVDPRGASIPEPLAFGVPDAARAAMQLLLGDRAAQGDTALRVGIAPAGGDADARAEPAIERFRPLAALPGIAPVLLCGGPALAHAGPGDGACLDLRTHCTDLTHMAAAIECMDVVVAPDGVAARLAASLGKPVVCLLPFRPYWIYGVRGESTPWYPAMRLVRQSAPGDWSSVFAELRRLLAGWGKARLRAAKRAR
jgi:tetratricopeptide (TPR) repeat protein